MLEIVKLRIQFFYLFKINLQTVNEFQSELSESIIFLLISQRASLSFTTILKIIISGEPLFKNFGVNSFSLSLAEWGLVPWPLLSVLIQWEKACSYFILMRVRVWGEQLKQMEWCGVSQCEGLCLLSQFLQRLGVLTYWEGQPNGRTALSVGASACEQLCVLCWRLLSGGHANRGLLSHALVLKREREGNGFIW